MPIVVLRSADSQSEVSVTTSAEASLGDLCDEHDAPIPFSCRSATCATCRVVVVEGAELLLPAEDEERSLLEMFGVDADASPLMQRLACQARVGTGPGRVVVRAVGDDEP